MPLPPPFFIETAQTLWHGFWQTLMEPLAPSDRQGHFQRVASSFRGAIPSPRFPAVPQRYVLYIGWTCPWAHRTAIVRVLKGLEGVIELRIARAEVRSGGWRLEGDPEGFRDMRSLYQRAQTGYGGRCSVPVLWDRHQQTIVNNESAEILVWLNRAFNEYARFPDRDLYPLHLQGECDRLNQIIYETVNNGVYRCGFARSQNAYDQAVTALFHTLDELEKHLGDRRYLLGEELTLADVRLFPTLIRFDWVYYSLFRCDRRRIIDYPNLWSYVRDIYQLPGIAATCPLNQIRQDYYRSLFPLNPSGIIPLGPDLDLLTIPPDRHS